jgi:outer membrane biosynthesis protein TonB
MRLSTGKRIGQSGQELLTASVFSLVLHVCAVAAAALLYISSAPKAFLPPFYSVKLVGLPSEAPAPSAAPQTSPTPPVPAPPPAQHQAKQPPAPKRAATEQHRAPAAPPKSGMPELSKASPKPEKPQPAPPVERPREQAASAPPAAAPGAPTGAGASIGAQGHGVAVATASQQDFKFSWYLALVRDKIAQNWRPSPDAPDARVRVVFSVNRSGWVGNVNVIEGESKCTFAFKQAGMRAIQASNPFPDLPEDFPKQTLEFSVDLTPNE